MRRAAFRPHDAASHLQKEQYLRIAATGRSARARDDDKAAARGRISRPNVRGRHALDRARRVRSLSTAAGGDIRPDALAAARSNIGPRYKPIELRTWNACDLPLDAGSVSSLACNLPFERKWAIAAKWLIYTRASFRRRAAFSCRAPRRCC